MNKYLMLTAAALLSSATTGDAKTYCFQFGSDFCDAGRIYTGGNGGAFSGTVRSWVHTSNNCVGGTSQGYGFLSKTPGLGNASLMSDDYFAKNYGNFSTAVSYMLPKKFKHFGSYSAWIGMNGTTFFQVGSGVIYPEDCQNPAVRHGRKSTLDALRELMRLHRKAKALSK